MFQLASFIDELEKALGANIDVITVSDIPKLYLEIEEILKE